ncbi:unnamed protein product [Pleuronectes platessa]|uniref:Uncharacterized protein n=1 Tax=Pleuronectes platessa TaxID=8262 RepID=A0A9N7Z6H5_PLEPL|nr:unnamed protein product [Pleuronectes platessa]
MNEESERETKEGGRAIVCRGEVARRHQTVKVEGTKKREEEKRRKKQHCRIGWRRGLVRCCSVLLWAVEVKEEEFES